MRAEVEAWFATDRPEQAATQALRAVLLDLGLAEALKWRQPCYMVDGRNVVILGVRKAGAVLSVLEGALLDDGGGQLLSAGPNTHAARILLFTSVEDVREREPLLRSLLTRAIALERAGRKVVRETPLEPLPVELLRCFEQDAGLKAACEALTPGRRRGYLLHGATRASTQTARIERARPRIVAGKGLHDCICGRSAKLPRCDGSHKDA